MLPRGQVNYVQKNVDMYEPRREKAKINIQIADRC